MAGDRFRPLLPGDPVTRLSARAWNAFCDTSREATRNRQLTGGGSGSDGTRETVVRIRNGSEGDLGQHDVLQVVDVMITPAENSDEFKNNWTLDGDTPDVDVCQAVCILQEPIKSGEYGDAVISGVTPARVNIISTDHRHAGLKDGDATQLESRGHGPIEILWQPGSTGASKVCLVVLGVNDDRQIILGKTDASHAKGASGTISVYEGATKGSETDTTRNVSAWNRFADLDSGKWVWCVWNGSGYDLIAGEC